jgi:hypothetical protein
MTSIEWLIQQIADRDYNNLPTWIYDLCSKSKEMHKQEITDAWKDGKGTLFSFSENKTSEQYYQETFVSKGSDELELPQQEISDKEIEKASNTLGDYYALELIMWEKGAKWYREQLKQRQ